MRTLLLNGVYGAPEHFDVLRAALAPDVETTIFPFRRGGLPDPAAATGFAPMIERLDRALGWYADDGEPVALIGFSLGGALALEYTLAHPGRVARLAMINSFGRFEQGPMQAGSMPAIRYWPGAWSDPRLTARLIHRLPAMRRGLFHPAASLAAIERGVRLATVSMSHDDVTFQIAHLALRAPGGWEERLAAVAERIPTLLAHSRDDLVVPPRHTRWLAARMPRARVLPPFEGGHAFFQHDAGTLAEAVRAFLAGEEEERRESAR